MFYLVHPDYKCLLKVTFYVANNDGSVLLSCVTTLALGLIQPQNRLDYVPPRASLITSCADHPKKTKSKISVHVSKKVSEVSNHKGVISKLITSKEQIPANYVDISDGIGCILAPIPCPGGSQHYTKANSLLTNPCAFEGSFQEGD